MIPATGARRPFRRDWRESRLWPFHAVHHSAPRLHWFNAARFHPAEMAVDATGEQLILVALGLDGAPDFPEDWAGQLGAPFRG